MSAAEEVSLLGHLDAPILVGDPDGCVVYANPSFRDRFCPLGADPVGEPIAMLFGGGAREVVLTATAEVLQRGQPAPLKLREADHAYLGLCSPIQAADDRVGVVMVLLEEDSNEELLTGLTDELSEPLLDAVDAVQDLSARIGGRLDAVESELLERSVRQLELAQKSLRELTVALRGGKAQTGRFDVAAAILRVVDRVRLEVPSSTDLEVLMPPNLPRAAGTPVVFERALSQLLRSRIDESEPGEPITVLARATGGEPARGILVSVVDVPNPDRRGPSGTPPDSVQQGVAQLGGDAVCVEDGVLGRVTALRLGVSSA